MTKQRKLGWKEVSPAGIIDDAGNAISYETGDWRTLKPVFLPENCIHCLFCWVFCPDTSIFVENGKFQAFDYKHCKGCGVCAKECPGKKGQKAIIMVPDE